MNVLHATNRRTAVSLFAAAALAACPFGTWAQDYPRRAVTIVTGYGLGSGGDLAIRVVADQLTKQLGRPFIVLAKPGAGNLLAARTVKDSPADGYTLFAGNPSVFSRVFLEKPLDAATELTPVGEFSRADAFVYTSVGSRIDSVKALVDAARRSTVRFGSINAGSALTIAMLAQALDIKYELIPFRTSEQIMQAMINDDVQVAVRSAGSYSQLVTAGKLHELATMSPSRSQFAPKVPTLKELGVPVELVVANGLWAPPGTPKAIVALLNVELRKALGIEKVLEGLRIAYQYPYHSTPEVQVEHLRAENAFYAKGAAMTHFVRN